MSIVQNLAGSVSLHPLLDILRVADYFPAQVLRDYTTEHLVLRDICLTSDSKWMICVGSYVQEDKRLPQKYGIIGELCFHILCACSDPCHSLGPRESQDCKVRSLFLSHDALLKVDDRKIPVFYDMSKISMAGDDRSVLISYENKVTQQLNRTNASS